MTATETPSTTTTQETTTSETTPQQTTMGTLQETTEELTTIASTALPTTQQPTTSSESVCLPTEFQCRYPKACIKREWRCDDVPDCPDRSDELNCRGIIWISKLNEYGYFFM